MTFGVIELAFVFLALPRERFVKSADGLTVHDSELHVTWLADANYPASEKFGLPIHASGAMTYQLARRWVAGLNGGAGYLGRVSPGCQGVDVAGMVAGAVALRQALADLGAEGMGDVDRTLLPVLTVRPTPRWK